LKTLLKNHIEYGQWFSKQVRSTPGFELMAPVPLNLICFRIKPAGITDEVELEKVNTKLLNKLNSSGNILLTQTKLDGKYVIRFVAGQATASQKTVSKGWNMIKDYAQEFLNL